VQDGLPNSHFRSKTVIQPMFALGQKPPFVNPGPDAVIAAFSSSAQGEPPPKIRESSADSNRADQGEGGLTELHDVRGAQTRKDCAYYALRAVFPKVISGLRKPIAIQAMSSLRMNLPE
jgi:hypothetical protein